MSVPNQISAAAKIEKYLLNVPHQARAENACNKTRGAIPQLGSIAEQRGLTVTNEAMRCKDTVEPLVLRGYRVAQAMTAEGLQALVNNLLVAGFEPVGGVSVTLIGTMHDEPILLHTQGLFYTSNAEVCESLPRPQTPESKTNENRGSDRSFVPASATSNKHPGKTYKSTRSVTVSKRRKP